MMLKTLLRSILYNIFNIHNHWWINSTKVANNIPTPLQKPNTMQLRQQGPHIGY